MKLNYSTILERANELYRDAKGEFICNHLDVKIHSDQVKSVLQALVEAINERDNSSSREAMIQWMKTIS